MRSVISTLFVLVVLCVCASSGCGKNTPPPPKNETFCDLSAVQCATYHYKQCCIKSVCIQNCTLDPNDPSPSCASDQDCAKPDRCSAVRCKVNGVDTLVDPNKVQDPSQCATVPASAPVAGDRGCFSSGTALQECNLKCTLLDGIQWPTPLIFSRCSGKVNPNHPYANQTYTANRCMDPVQNPQPLASQGTNAIALNGSGTATLNGQNQTPISIIGGYFDIAAPFTTCNSMQATCPTQINQIEVDFSDFTLDGHKVVGLALRLDGPVITPSGQFSMNSFLFQIPQNVVFDAIGTVDGTLAGLVVKSAKPADASIDLSTGKLAFQFDVQGTFNGKTLEANGTATTAQLLALAPVVTPGAVTINDLTNSCAADVTLTASATSAFNLPVRLDYILDNSKLLGTGSSVTTTLPIGGAHEIMIVGTDTNGMEHRVAETVTPNDTLGPVVTTISSPITVWPPDHQYVTVALDQCVTNVVDQCDGALDPLTHGEITSVTSNEPANAPGSGNTCNDMVIVNQNTVKLRAERDGGGQGRVYTIHFTESDSHGNKTPATCKVQVPHDQSGTPAKDTAPVSCVGTTCNGVPGPGC